ncbi:MAG TPA: HAMP domain-containing sensor histidine kinase [Paracoccaceae bacterium]|nr:HAMP domain-containing sensor histidine kinase [Paracoccaceae bacterium]
MDKPALSRSRIITRMLLALAGLVLLLAALGALSIWGIQRAETELRHAEQSLAQLENVRAIDAAFNRYLLIEVERRLRGGGDPAESPEAGIVRGALLTYRRAMGAGISASSGEIGRAELIRANALAGIFEEIETGSVFDRIAGRHFSAGQAARSFQAEVVGHADDAFGALISEVVEDEGVKAAQAFGRLEALRHELAILWSALAIAFLVAATGFGIAFYRGLMRPIAVLTAAAEGIDGSDSARPVRERLPGEFQLLADRMNAMAARIGSEQRRLRDQVASRTADLEAANRRLTSIDKARRQFFANLSHELRTPVTVLLGEAQVALRVGPEEQRAALERIAASGGMLTRRLNDLMRLARSEEGELTLEMVPCNLGEAVRGAVEAARAYARSQEVDLEFEGGAECHVMGDADALRQAALALIDNAIKLSAPGSSVEVRLCENGFEVADRGPGFDGCDPAVLFRRYVQEGAGRRAGGSGLGLAIVGWISERHGAAMHVEERPGGGAVFRMEFPS